MDSKTKVASDIAKQVFAHHGNPSTKMRLAIKWFNAMRHEGADFDVMCDAFALYASWNGHRVTVDAVEWTPPLVEAEVQ